MSLYAMGETIPEYYIICLINSTFMSYYVDTFVNNTQTFQINDARQLPVIIPDKKTINDFEEIFNNAIAIKTGKSNGKLNEIQNRLDKSIASLYQLS